MLSISLAVWNIYKIPLPLPSNNLLYTPLLLFLSLSLCLSLHMAVNCWYTVHFSRLTSHNTYFHVRDGFWKKKWYIATSTIFCSCVLCPNCCFKLGIQLWLRLALGIRFKIACFLGINKALTWMCYY